MTDGVRTNINDYWSQITVIEAGAYHDARGNEAWIADQAAQTQALQRAWDYMETLPWVGEFIIDDGVTPTDIKNAQALLALRELEEPGILTPALTRDDYLSSKGIASGAVSKSYRADAPAWKRFKGIELLLAPYIKPISCFSLELM